MNPQVLMPEHAAAYLGVSLIQLYRWRRSGIGPPYLVWGRRTLRYRVADLDRWLQSQDSVVNTAQAEQLLKKVN